MNYKKIIESKKSVRNYKDDEVERNEKNEIIKFFDECIKLKDNIKVEMRILDKNKVYSKLDKIAGYNGFMIKAPSYIVLVSEIKDNYIENSGYIGEQLSIKAKDLGIDSCWITINDNKKVTSALGFSEDKEVTCIIAIGYGEKHSNTKIVNKSQTDNYYSKTDLKIENDNTSERLSANEIVYIEKWGNNASAEELEDRGLIEAFQFTALAPSTLNKQPCRFIIDGGTVILAVRKNEKLSDYEQKIDASISMLYFDLIVSTTLIDIKWILGKPEKEYKIPENYEILGYCRI